MGPLLNFSLFSSSNGVAALCTVGTALLIMLCYLFFQSRLAVNAVTSGDYNRPMRIAKFVGDLDSGFRLLNLKNDSLRKRFDGLKYDLKKVEEVVYDVTIRGLHSPRPTETAVATEDTSTWEWRCLLMSSVHSVHAGLHVTMLVCIVWLKSNFCNCFISFQTIPPFSVNIRSVKIYLSLFWWGIVLYLWVFIQCWVCKIPFLFQAQRSLQV